MGTIISWLILIGQVIALFVLLRNVPPFIIAIIRTIRFKDQGVKWNSSLYTQIIIAILYLLFVGFPKFF